MTMTPNRVELIERAHAPRTVQQLSEAIIAPKDDLAFRPLVLFNGNATIGRMQSLWNLLKTMEILEVATTADLWELTKASHDTTHRCGIHSPVQRSTIWGFTSRVLQAPEFKPFQYDKSLREYMRWFVNANGLFVLPMTPIGSISDWKSRRSWRNPPKLAHKPLNEVWPFLDKRQKSVDHMDIMLVDSLVPKSIPEQWRQDMCQDLYVAVLSGEVSPDELQSGAWKIIKRIWKEHPFKYGPLSLDAPAPGSESDLKLGDMLTCPHFEDAESEDDDLTEVYRSEVRR